MNLLNRMWLLLRNGSGQAAVDYALISMVVAFAIIGSFYSLAANVDHAFVKTNRVFNAAITSCLSHHH
jgi:Flp pilus assembly pilin Flp